jgi:hypothetical protein
MYGNDFQTWEDPADDGVVLAVAKGIKSADPNQIHTTELNYLSSGSLDDGRWEPIVDLDGVYTYYPTYAQVLKEYNRPNFKPVFMEDANYEFGHNANTDGGSLSNLRHQEYWTMLSGGAALREQIYVEVTRRMAIQLAIASRYAGCCPARLHAEFGCAAQLVRPCA